MADLDKRPADDGKSTRRKWTKPVIESDTIYETQALGCAQCVTRPHGAIGFGDGNCMVATRNY